MSYCTLDDVNGLLIGLTIDDNTDPSASDVTNKIIPESDLEIEDRLRVYYQVPITGTDALKTMQRISTWLTASKVTERIYIGQTPSDSPQATTWHKYAEADLKRLVDGNIILTDAVSTDDTPESKSHQISDKLSQPGYTTGPQFTMGMKF